MQVELSARKSRFGLGEESYFFLDSYGYKQIQVQSEAALIPATLHRNGADFRQELAAFRTRKINQVLGLLFRAVPGVRQLANKYRNLYRCSIARRDELGLKWVELMLLTGCCEGVIIFFLQKYRRSLVIECGLGNLLLEFLIFRLHSC